MGRDIVITIAIVVLVSAVWGWACIPFAARRDVSKVVGFVSGALLWPIGLAVVAVRARRHRPASASTTGANALA